MKKWFTILASLSLWTYRTDENRLYQHNKLPCNQWNPVESSLTSDNLVVQEQQRKGVIVATDCNFSMAVAHHAVELKIPVFVIMPSCCSSSRLRVYRDYGAMVISYGGTSHDSQKHARHLARENGYLFLEESVISSSPLTLRLGCAFDLDRWQISTSI